MAAEKTPSTGNNPLEQFVLLAKSAKGAAAVELIKQVLEAPGVYVFGELLDMPNVKELENGPHDMYYQLLQLFAHGTYRQYMESREKLLELTPVQKKKLQHLTIVTLATKSKCIPYSVLLQELDIKNVRDLEDLIIEAIYADIIHGKLDQKNHQLEVDYAIGRDILPEDIGTIIGTLQEWCDSCETVLSCVETQINRANAEKNRSLKHRDIIEQEVANIKKTLKTQSQDSEEAMATDSREAMAQGSDKGTPVTHHNRTSPYQLLSLSSNTCVYRYITKVDLDVYDAERHEYAESQAAQGADLQGPHRHPAMPQLSREILHRMFIPITPAAEQQHSSDPQPSTSRGRPRQGRHPTEDEIHEVLAMLPSTLHQTQSNLQVRRGPIYERRALIQRARQPFEPGSVVNRDNVLLSSLPNAMQPVRQPLPSPLEQISSLRAALASYTEQRRRRRTSRASFNPRRTQRARASQSSRDRRNEERALQHTQGAHASQSSQDQSNEAHAAHSSRDQSNEEHAALQTQQGRGLRSSRNRSNEGRRPRHVQPGRSSHDQNNERRAPQRGRASQSSQNQHNEHGSQQDYASHDQSFEKRAPQETSQAQAGPSSLDQSNEVHAPRRSLRAQHADASHSSLDQSNEVKAQEPDPPQQPQPPSVHSSDSEDHEDGEL